jgi:cytochrome c-type biogenesis protein CcmE
MKPKFLIGIGLIFAAVIAVMAFTILGNSSMEVKVNDLLARQQKGELTAGRSLKLTGVVVGDSVVYDPATLKLEFDIVHDRDQLESNLANAQRVRVVYAGVKPDTLVNEAHAIVTGKLAGDGKFHAGTSPDALLLQCPTKYEDLDKEASN